jgi:hypothetical protein
MLAAAAAKENTYAKFFTGHLYQCEADPACACTRANPMNLGKHLYRAITF